MTNNSIKLPIKTLEIDKFTKEMLPIDFIIVASGSIANVADGLRGRAIQNQQNKRTPI